MKTNQLITLITIAFTLIGIIFLNLVQPQQVLSTAAFIAYAVAEHSANNDNAQSQNAMAMINGFFVKHQLPEATREKYLPIYILVNMLFIALVVTVYYKKQLAKK